MSIRKSYDQWSVIYDGNKNKTRDLEAISLRKILTKIKYKSCLELGCGTGKNTEYLAGISEKLISVDFSEEMLRIAKSKIKAENVRFYKADILKDWDFDVRKFDLVVVSLVLEHIKNLKPVFERISQHTTTGSYLYISELHPFKQYSGTKACFEAKDGKQILKCFIHNTSDFINQAQSCGFGLETIQEYFDNKKTEVPRILTMLFKKRKVIK